jgi:hypothetical protein
MDGVGAFQEKASTKRSLHYACIGRDDKGEDGYSWEGWRVGWTELELSRRSIRTEISPLRFASVEMTKGEDGYFSESWRFGWTELVRFKKKHPRSRKSGCAPVEMTKGRVATLWKAGELDGRSWEISKRSSHLTSLAAKQSSGRKMLQIVAGLRMIWNEP